MGDLLFVAIVIGFFAICVAYVKACEHIIGPDPDPGISGAGADSATRTRAGATPTTDGSQPDGSPVASAATGGGTR